MANSASVEPDPQVKAERILDAWQFWRDDKELSGMNGQRCGGRQRRMLKRLLSQGLTKTKTKEANAGR